MDTSTDYYCYVYKEEDGTPYYIGKGKKFRYLIKNKNEVQPPKDKSRIFFACEGVSEIEAFEMEVALISLLGRKDLGTGILLNRTNGGDGSSGTIPSLESRQRMSDSQKGRKHTEESKIKIGEASKGITRSEESKRKNSESHKGKVFSESTRRRMSEAHKGKVFSESTRKKLSLSNSIFTEQQQLEIFQRRENGESVVELANEFEVTQKTIYRVLEKLGKPQS